MKIRVRRWIIDREKDKYINPEEKNIAGKNAADIMRQFNDLRNVSDLFSHTAWQIIDIKD